MNLGPDINVRRLINSEAYRRQGYIFRQVYVALRFSRDKNKAATPGVYWDCGFLGVKDGIIPLIDST